MSVQELEKAITKLPESELAEFSRWFEDFQQQAWDRQIARDVKAGRFETLITRARERFAAGQSRPL